MEITFTMSRAGEYRKESEQGGNRVAEAELVLEGELRGLKLAGFAVRKQGDGTLYVTFPAKAFGIGGQRRYFDFLRTVDGCLDPVKSLKARVLDAYSRLGDARRVPGAAITVEL